MQLRRSEPSKDVVSEWASERVRERDRVSPSDSERARESQSEPESQWECEPERESVSFTQCEPKKWKMCVASWPCNSSSPMLNQCILLTTEGWNTAKNSLNKWGSHKIRHFIINDEYRVLVHFMANNTVLKHFLAPKIRFVCPKLAAKNVNGRFCDWDFYSFPNCLLSHGIHVYINLLEFWDCHISLSWQQYHVYRHELDISYLRKIFSLCGEFTKVDRVRVKIDKIDKVGKGGGRQRCWECPLSSSPLSLLS